MNHHSRGLIKSLVEINCNIHVDLDLLLHINEHVVSLYKPYLLYVIVNREKLCALTGHF